VVKLKTSHKHSLVVCTIVRLIHKTELAVITAQVNLNDIQHFLSSVKKWLMKSNNMRVPQWCQYP